jgi:hypothetical protein
VRGKLLAGYNRNWARAAQHVAAYLVAEKERFQISENVRGSEAEFSLYAAKLLLPAFFAAAHRLFAAAAIFARASALIVRFPDLRL